MTMTWDELAVEMRELISKSQMTFDPCTIQNFEDFLAVARPHISKPDGVDEGYWATLCILWPAKQLEIFSGHYEFYHFLDGKTDTWHFDHNPGDPFPEDLRNLLPINSDQGPHHPDHKE